MITQDLEQDKAMHLKTTFFNEEADLNDTAMMEYGLNKDDPDLNDKKGSSGLSKANKGNEPEYMIKFDSQGKKMKLKRAYVVQGALERYGDRV